MGSNSAQNDIEIEHITADDGLSYRWVFDIIQDENGFMWFGTYEGLNRYDGTSFKIYRNDLLDTNSLSNNQIKFIAEDRQGSIWVMGEDRVLNRIDVATDSIIRIELYDISNPEDLFQLEVLNIIDTKNGDFWVIIQDQAKEGWLDFWKLNNQNQFELFPMHDLPNIHMVHASYIGDGDFWIWTLSDGFFLVNPFNNGVEHFPIPNQSAGQPLPIDDNGKFWYPDAKKNITTIDLDENFNFDSVIGVTTDKSGVISILFVNDKLVSFNSESKDYEVFASPIIKDLVTINEQKQIYQRFYQDKENATWIGHFYGASKLKNTETLFKKYLSIEQPNPSVPVTGISARSMTQNNAEGFIWLIDQPNDLYKLHVESGLVDSFKYEPSASVDHIDAQRFLNGLVDDGIGHLWRATSDGIWKLNIANQEYDRINLPEDKPVSQANIFQSRSGDLWVATELGLSILDPTTNQYSFPQDLYPIKDQGLDFTYAHYNDDTNEIYGRYNNGVFVVDCSLRKIAYHPILNLENSGAIIYSYLKWNDDFWLGTTNGLMRFNALDKDLQWFTTEDGLPHNIIYSVLNSERDLWLGTHNGLCQFDPSTNKVTTYFEEQGLPQNEFNRWSSLEAKDGTLLFGGLNGVISFDPNDFLLSDSTKGNLHLVGMTKLNVQKDTLIDVPIFPTNMPDKLTIGSNERVVSFQYALSLYDDVEKNQYYHYMEGLETGWIEDGSQNEVRYFQIPPGEYTFRVKANGPRKIPANNELAISIKVLQVWYLRWWALSSYVLLTMMGVAFLYRFQLSRKMEKQEANRIKELDHVKTKMYTNITHEFRTPLTVMIGMNNAAEEFSKKGKISEAGNAHDMVDRNGKTLLGLVNQMLDLSKLESGQMDLTYEQSDIKLYLKYLTESMRPFAESKKIKVHFYSKLEEIIIDFDKEKIAHIYNNLLSNAIKFTPGGGDIYIELNTKEEKNKNSFFEFSVRDTGVGISSAQLPHIFDRFYQVDDSNTRDADGTGIGLSLVNELVKLKGGMIDVVSKIGVGTTFVVKLPITNKATLIEVGDKVSKEVSRRKSTIVGDSGTSDILLKSTSPLGDKKPLLLIVEDNPDIRHYIRICIEKDYDTILAKDGEEGIQKAINQIPDLIISDVMMPNKDGFELCHEIKTDVRTNHIPVILLTAKSDMESKIEGLEYGADAYLTKPFDQKELLVRLKKLFELRKALQARYANIDLSVLPSQEESNTKNEDPLITKARTILLDKMEDEDFGIIQLCRAMRISRAQLHRKLTALTGMSTSHFIRKVRLHRAKTLLAAGEMNVSEVAYAVGFKNQSHFSRVYGEEFGESPSGG